MAFNLMINKINKKVERRCESCKGLKKPSTVYEMSLNNKYCKCNSKNNLTRKD